MSQKAVCLLIHNPLADISALAWLLKFEDFRISSPINGVSNGSITTFLQTLPSISAARFLSAVNVQSFTYSFESKTFQGI